MNTSHPAKSRIRQSFERAASTYDEAADVQRRICKQLFRHFSHNLGEFRTVLDAGCGTGYALELLKTVSPHAEKIALDLSMGMLKRVDPVSTRRIQGDLEHLPLADHSIDLYWSSLAAQSSKMSKTLGEARRILADGGHLLLATLGESTFHELRSAFTGVDNHAHTLDFLSQTELEHLASAAGFSSVTLAREAEIAYFPDFRDLLMSVKATGANQVGSTRRKQLLGKKSFEHAAAVMERLRTPAGLPLTYDVMYLYART